ncbi:spermidine synthase [Sphingomonas sp. So64.6b]|uniref:spermine/spermidine synthase domain-containing protein n=1 Tax=Sphingomonas sp. So64.6b TaxID=2997354 RepID=UPI001600A16E|nr:spermidine synthase [Sphingomonas sp. So64.6b]QNA86520.1 spermidine synthase [Sphingomonas sp. So64.6b]
MVPRELIDSAEIPGGGVLKLFRRGDDWSIMLGGNELMSSRVRGSEEALATLALERIGRADANVLIGGLGMGFTLRAALAVLGARARLTVAELVPAVIDWAHGAMAAVHEGSLDDPRVVIIETDVGALIRAGSETYDAILLDVDNGPDGLTRGGNNALYSTRGLAAARSALRPGGVLAIWSAGADAAFARRLRDGFAVEEMVVRSGSGGKGARHIIWLAERSR